MASSQQSTDDHPGDQMSRRSHGLVALVAIALLVALVALVGWWTPPASTPGSAPQVPSASTTLPGSVPPSSAPTAPSPASQTVVPGGTLTPCPPAGEKQTITIATFNIHGGLGGGGLHLEQVAGEIAATGADVVLLQEVDRFRPRTDLVDEPAYLAALLGMTQMYAANVVLPAEQDGDPDEEYGTAVLSRLPVDGWTHNLLPHQRGTQQRGLQRVRITLGDRTISVYNTHLEHTSPRLRQAQMRQIRALVGTDPDPVVLGGDFNATPDSPALAIALRDLLDPWPVVGLDDGLTVPERVPRRRVDYLLTDDSFRPVTARTWDSAVSDHRGLVVRFRLLPPRVCR